VTSRRAGTDSGRRAGTAGRAGGEQGRPVTSRETSRDGRTWTDARRRRAEARRRWPAGGELGSRARGAGVAALRRVRGARGCRDEARATGNRGILVCLMGCCWAGPYPLWQIRVSPADTYQKIRIRIF
jgi:hypothetical protein